MKERITIPRGCYFIRRLKTRIGRYASNKYGGYTTLNYSVEKEEYEREKAAFKIRERKRHERGGPELQRDIEEDDRREWRVTREDLLYDDNFGKYHSREELDEWAEEFDD